MHAYGHPTGQHGQEQVEQTVAMSNPKGPSPDRDQAQYLRDQLAHRDAELEHVRSERDTDLPKKKTTCTYAPTQLCSKRLEVKSGE